jgi:hypothetical protein
MNLFVKLRNMKENRIDRRDKKCFFLLLFIEYIINNKQNNSCDEQTFQTIRMV